jgi:hypothetical protein
MPYPRTALRLTLVVLLLRPPDNDWVRTATWATAAAGLVWPALAERAWFWMIVTAAIGVRLAADWPLADNHIYLVAYWCLAVALACRTTAPAVTLARAARALVGVTFLFAVVWKVVLAPEFLDERFFRVTLLTDERFEWIVQSIGGVSASTLRENRAALEPLPPGVEVVGGPTLTMPPSFTGVARVLTWGGVLLETAVAVVFLVPRWRGVTALRHGLLLAFCTATYAVAPVAGFGWLLAIFGLAQTEKSQTAVRVAYVAVFACIGILSEANVAGAVVARL